VTDFEAQSAPLKRVLDRWRPAFAFPLRRTGRRLRQRQEGLIEGFRSRYGGVRIVRFEMIHDLAVRSSSRNGTGNGRLIW